MIVVWSRLLEVILAATGFQTVGCLWRMAKLFHWYWCLPRVGSSSLSTMNWRNWMAPSAAGLCMPWFVFRAQRLSSFTVLYIQGEAREEIFLVTQFADGSRAVAVSRNMCRRIGADRKTRLRPELFGTESDALWTRYILRARHPLLGTGPVLCSRCSDPATPNWREADFTAEQSFRIQVHLSCESSGWPRVHRQKRHAPPADCAGRRGSGLCRRQWKRSGYVHNF